MESDIPLPNPVSLARMTRRRRMPPAPLPSADILPLHERQRRSLHNARLLREAAMVRAEFCNSLVAGEVFDRFFIRFLRGEIPRDGGGWRQGIRWIAGVPNVRIYGRDRESPWDKMGFDFWTLRHKAVNWRDAYK